MPITPARIEPSTRGVSTAPRVIRVSSAGAPPREIETTTGVPCWPRMAETTSVRLSPAVCLPSTVTTRSPGRSPARAAGLPWNTSTMTGGWSGAGFDIRTPIPVKLASPMRRASSGSTKREWSSPRFDSIARRIAQSGRASLAQAGCFRTTTS